MPSRSQMNCKRYKNKVSFEDSLASCRHIVANSSMMLEICNKLRDKKFRMVRCLALGSFHESLAARYQLALLLEVLSQCCAPQSGAPSVSIYDPAFTEDDLAYIAAQLAWTLDPELSFPAPDHEVLFFLPHAPIEITDAFFGREKPEWYLANSIVAHTERQPRAKLDAQYPILGALSRLLEPTQKVSDGFSTVPSAKKPRRHRKRTAPRAPPHSPAAPPPAPPAPPAFQGQCTLLTDFDNGALLSPKNHPWQHAFSDLCLYRLQWRQHDGL